MTLNTHDIFSTETVAIQSPIESEDGKVWFVSKGFRIEGGISLVDSTSVYLLFLLSFFRSHSFFFFSQSWLYYCKQFYICKVLFLGAKKINK